MSTKHFTKEVGGIPIIAIEGQADIYSAPRLKQEMIRLLEAGKTPFVIDLTMVEYIDSTALGVLIGGLKRVKALDSNMPLICPIPRIRKIFKITGLDKYFDIFQNETEAIELLGEAQPAVAGT